ncbi:hypothetical protein QNJ95_42685 [Bradyrhizobium elkanii]|uniref:hypothetical protein n=1 Tax=Bradyrhizobium TaxID=374 RepID=UPI0027120EE6|nr:hypothetical protein [Bradyrhizobium elkanii]WLA39478.1 hypothetical protein QNJ95_42685 [Bradyrhizobium elkanii]
MTDNDAVDWLGLNDPADASKRSPGLVVGGVARENELRALEDAMGPPGFGAFEIAFLNEVGHLDDGEGMRWQAIMGFSREPSAAEVLGFIYSRRMRLLHQHHANLRAAVLRDDAAEKEQAKISAQARSRRPPAR